MKILVPEELDAVIKKQKDKPNILRVIKLYEAFIYKRNKRKGWFDVPGKYLKRINSAYYKSLPELINAVIIECNKKYYIGRCYKYRFLIDTERETENTYYVTVNVDKEGINQRTINERQKGS